MGGGQREQGGRAAVLHAGVRVPAAVLRMRPALPRGGGRPGVSCAPPPAVRLPQMMVPPLLERFKEKNIVMSKVGGCFVFAEGLHVRLVLPAWQRCMLLSAQAHSSRSWIPLLRCTFWAPGSRPARRACAWWRATRSRSLMWPTTWRPRWTTRTPRVCDWGGKIILLLLLLRHGGWFASSQLGVRCLPAAAAARAGSSMCFPCLFLLTAACRSQA